MDVSHVLRELESLLRNEVDDCERAIRNEDLDRARREIGDVEDKMKRIIYKLRQLR